MHREWQPLHHQTLELLLRIWLASLGSALPPVFFISCQRRSRSLVLPPRKASTSSGGPQQLINDGFDCRRIADHAEATLVDDRLG